VSRKVVVVGQGYVGLPIAMRAVEVGYDVVGLDNNAARVARLCTADSFVEDVPSTEIAAALQSGRYVASTEAGAASGFDVAVITVPTPLRESVPDLSYIESAARSLAPFVRAGSLVVLESTTYPGTTDELMLPLLEEGSGLKGGVDFFVGYSPERIDPGNPTWTFVTTPKVVSGIDRASLDAVASFYGSLVDEVVPVSTCRSAELTKLLENTFRHVNIALVNELAVFAKQLGIDVWEAIDAASSKPFGFMKFTPGPGVGGHCLPIDPSYLSWRVRQTLGRQFRFVELANDVNDHMPDYVVARLTLALNDRAKAVRGSSILLLGLTYKKNSSDARESPAVKVAQLLLELGADLEAVDPYISESPPAIHDLTVNAQPTRDVSAYDAVVVLTDHDSFDFEMIAGTAKLVLDTRHRMPPLDSVEYL
jgi:UDP-N-acetyl-D-glucosamine dehydrogenase